MRGFILCQPPTRGKFHFLLSTNQPTNRPLASFLCLRVSERVKERERERERGRERKRERERERDGVCECVCVFACLSVCLSLPLFPPLSFSFSFSLSLPSSPPTHLLPPPCYCLASSSHNQHHVPTICLLHPPHDHPPLQRRGQARAGRAHCPQGEGEASLGPALR